MSRQARRSKRIARKEQEALQPRTTADTPIDRERTLAKFKSLTGRSVQLGYVPCGPDVEARNPAELEANTARALKSNEPAN